jgi:Ubiquinone biosynthesis protein COQ7
MNEMGILVVKTGEEALGSKTRSRAHFRLRSICRFVLISLPLSASMFFRLPLTYRTVSCAVCSHHTMATAPQTPSAVYMDPSKSRDPAVASTPGGLTAMQREALDSALRVDQAGEVAANWIYKGQFAVLGRDPTAGPLIQVCCFNFNLHTNSYEHAFRKCGIRRRNIYWS